MHYARYDGTTGKITGLYDDQLNLDIPSTDCVAITDEEWSMFLEDQPHWKIDVATGSMIYVEDPLLDYSVEQLAEMKKTEVKRACDVSIEAGAPTPFGYSIKCDTVDIAMFKAGIEFEIGCAAEREELTSCTAEELNYIANGIIPPNVYISSEVNALPMAIKTLDAGIQMTTVGGAKYINSLQINQFNNIYRRKWELESTLVNILAQYHAETITEAEAKTMILALNWAGD
jgi:hypothetical protein